MAEILGKTGEKLCRALELPTDGYEITVLIIEAARVGDRLEQLNSILTGAVDVWTRLSTGRDGTLEIRVDAALQEARQQAGTLRQLLAEIRRQRGGYEPDEGDVLAGL
ncbi:hypothetical protein [Nocardia terpenica]|uniref:Uncharacterized protein n=1 Tax=Nocardia terpenica TaxID=455432 RepID=A0A164JVR2_9NOCA|nr:hypothetical protein [Nocardia terpenica]KZM70767.1 hypothetical protein AWN90_40115 [Nocardia terpenica]NQE89967.1 hypothetical protein [Nocardia terpenica]